MPITDIELDYGKHGHNSYFLTLREERPAPDAPTPTPLVPGFSARLSELDDLFLKLYDKGLVPPSRGITDFVNNTFFGLLLVLGLGLRLSVEHGEDSKDWLAIDSCSSTSISSSLDEPIDAESALELISSMMLSKFSVDNCNL